ncbi:uncharacterized protein N7477_003982 [Penicillium maclennaniae]|uniref:uncharacterized protein n=1 Tax=Penicillium maclennaniae TaxID=1343394 RepID=UPI002541EB9D|nr:uncharacterized protein N7477_003982 [Penicillium maclennaniae]KAJ5678349.1 hypothetical protein N7477_003982 [Penicillium maclennaniae]
MAPIYNSNGSSGPSDTDAISDYIRISLKADRPKQDPDEGPLIPASPESEADNSSNSDSSPR